MKIAVVGAGYVGLSTAAALSELGHEVVCFDKNEKIINNLQEGKIHLLEPGVEEVVNKNLEGSKLIFTGDDKEIYEDTEVIICAVGTPDSDVSQVEKVTKQVGKYAKNGTVYLIKSTLPVGATDKCRELILNSNIAVVYNPEFLRQGTALEDTLNPDRIVVGMLGKQGKGIIGELYKPLTQKGIPIVYTDYKSAEIIKYAANAFLSTKISFINDIANFCEKAGGNINDISKAIGLDKRIGSEFLNAGIGYGGSCLPKDTKDFIKLGKFFKSPMRVLKAVHKTNQKQTKNVIKKLGKAKKITVWGVTFKPNTNDLRDAPSLRIVDKLLRQRRHVNVFDPIEGKNFINRFKKNSNINLHEDLYDSVKDSDAILLLTEWDQFINVDFARVKELMRGDLIVDGRNLFNPDLVRNWGFKYYGIGLN